MGAWIETYIVDEPEKQAFVAPYVGAWIETVMFHSYIVDEPVAPYVGAWIETQAAPTARETDAVSHPTWVRGLKQKADSIITMQP